MKNSDDVLNIDVLNQNSTVNYPRSHKTIEITQDNYENYFNIRTGKIIDASCISKGDTLKIGNISNRAFVIDRQLILMPISSNDKISNGFIHLIKGSDGSTVTNLTINNTKDRLNILGGNVGQLHGIWLSNSNNNLISYNTIRIANAAGVYAMPMGWSSNNRIIYNNMKTYITCNMVMGQCHYNLISHNSLELLSYSDTSVTNLIYFNPFGHADYSGSGLCKYNMISFNDFKGFSNGPMSILLQSVYENHDGTVIANNTFSKGSYAIHLFGNNISVYGNVVLNSGIGISVFGRNFSVHNNAVIGDSQGYGIMAEANGGSLCNVYNNNITFIDVYNAIFIGNHVKAYNNYINIKEYGVSIFIKGNCSNIHDNRINNKHDAGISVLGNNNTINNNIINTKNIGITLPARSTNCRYYNNTFTNNKINSESYGIYIDGLVYNCIILDNIIETNSSMGIFKDITDELSNIEENNMVNGVILDSTYIIVNNTNYHKYFDKYGHLTFKFEKNKTKIIFLTFLTNKNLIFQEKINVISNKMNNLLINVTITFETNASGSLIRDFNFINHDKEAIILNGVNDVTVTRNNITNLFRNGSLSNSAVLIQDVCENLIISYNNIYVNSRTYCYTYAINAPSINPATHKMNNKLSKRVNILDNTIIMISSGITEAIYTDTLSESNFISNKINIISKNYGYGIAVSNMIGRLSDINVSNNEIVIHSEQMAYLIELLQVDNSTIENNKLYGKSNGVYAIGIYWSDNISVNNNAISVFGGNLSKILEISDVLGIGNSAIAILRNSSKIIISENIIYANLSKTIFDNTTDGIINASFNSFIIDNENYNCYFNEVGELYSNVVIKNSTLLIHNLTKNQLLIINDLVKISSYDLNSPSSISIIFKNNASNSIISNASFINSSIDLINVSNINIINNTFNSSNSCILNINGGEKNLFVNNELFINSTDISVINLNKTLLNIIKNNNIKFNTSNSKIITINNSNFTLISNNVIIGISDSLIFICSKGSSYDNIYKNILNANASSICGYLASNAKWSSISYNNILINKSTNQSAIYYCNNSSNNTINENYIISYSLNANDYAVSVISNESLSNLIIKNYLISSNGFKRANFAVYAPFDLVKDNSPFDIYVSCNGSDVVGDGSIDNPYATIKKAIENSLNLCVIHVFDGNYTESNIIIDKNLTLVAVNLGKVFIDVQTNQLFDILEDNTLSISGFLIGNAHNVDGGSVFINNGKLFINNVVIFNSSSYFDNSHPIFDQNITYHEDNLIDKAHTVDCSNTGKGGAILNNGELIINSSIFFNNFGHSGGVIADYGKTIINSSIFYNNRGIHGGCIYSDSKNNLFVINSIFNNNTAVTSIDFCKIMLHSIGWSIGENYIYNYKSECDSPIGAGGVIYTKNTSVLIKNSSFIYNSARIGGVIATQCDIFTQLSNFISDVNLYIDNCYFNSNKANDTRFKDDPLYLKNYDYFNDYNGGVVYGTYNKLYINASNFYYNQVINNGGVLYAKANDGKIIDSIFNNNRAGSNGGALDISKNFLIMRSIISNNSARYGGAIEYDSYTYYGHIQDNFNIYNSTISNNKALNAGGAFNIGSGNVSVHDSNIVNNFAPSGTTINSHGIKYAIDMRYNYWGVLPNGHIGPDDSVWNVNHNLFKPWYKQWVEWKPKVIESNNSGFNSNSSNHNPYINPNSNSGGNNHNNPISTGSSSSTTTSIGGANGNNHGYGNGKYFGSGDGNNLGPSSGNGGFYLAIPGYNKYNGQNVNSNTSSNSHKSQNRGNVDSDSLSKSNSSKYNPDLVSAGFTVNAASSPSSSQRGIERASKESGSLSDSASYEITKKIKEVFYDENHITTFILFIIIILFLIILGYKYGVGKFDE
ncbi:hypothetical protein SAMN05216439_0937 [Methanobrevibacter gottschalkii]|uniref:Parallel beta-helix repeat (Two copies) n=1 Tax=Methanobrevibacter gottschalkii TaxID=190974 RepID=A0A1H7GZ78_9EURY|nr:adhesin [Methanobrevibacter gottschalkii]SEK43443.1 hypothetical protein SAMN05216439_0937 [Methanobrevibacter gottschalkii]